MSKYKTFDELKEKFGSFRDDSSFKVVEGLDQYPDTKEAKSGLRVLDTYTNLQWLLSNFNAVIRYNLMTRKREISFLNLSIPKEDSENAALFMVFHIATINDMPIKSIDNHLEMIALNNTYHPIVESIKNKPWDKVSRLYDFIRTIEATNPELAYKIILTWMVAAVAAAHSQDGFMNHGVLVLHGKQKIGKTTWVTNLDPINCGAVKESAFLDPTNKDSIIQLNSYWISELAEVDAVFKKSDVGRLKAFITTKSDYVRNPYARKSTVLPRRSAYIATVNVENFLTDDTGNRRWWTISILKINNEHNLDMQQVWAEVYEIWINGHKPYLDSELENQVDESNYSYEKINPLKEKMLNFYDWSDTSRRWLTASQVLEEIGYHKPNRADATEMGVLLKEINDTAGKRIFGKTLHQVPCRIVPKSYYS